MTNQNKISENTEANPYVRIYVKDERTNRVVRIKHAMSFRDDKPYINRDIADLAFETGLQHLEKELSL